MPKTTREGTVRWRIGSSLRTDATAPSRARNGTDSKPTRNEREGIGWRAGVSSVLYYLLLNAHRKRLGVGLRAQGQARETALQQRHQSCVPVAQYEQDQKRHRDVILVADGVVDR